MTKYLHASMHGKTVTRGEPMLSRWPPNAEHTTTYIVYLPRSHVVNGDHRRFTGRGTHSLREGSLTICSIGRKLMEQGNDIL